MSVQSVERAFAVLRALAAGPLGVTDLAARVDLPKSTVARLLAALEAEGAVTQDEAGGLYRLGSGLLDIAGAAQPGRNLVATARPYLLELAESVGEIAGLSVPDGANVYYLDHTEADSDVHVRDWTGEYAPLHAVPSGLVVLAHMADADVDAYLARPLEASTRWTVVDADAIRERLETVRSIGYAWGYEEFAEGINSVAAPVLTPAGAPEGRVAAVLHVHGPAYRFPDPDRTHDVGTSLIDAAARLAAQLTE